MDSNTKDFGIARLIAIMLIVLTLSIAATHIVGSVTTDHSSEQMYVEKCLSQSDTLLETEQCIEFIR